MNVELKTSIEQHDQVADQQPTGFYRPIDFPPIFTDSQRMRAIAAMARQHFNAPSSLTLEPR